PLYFFHAYSHPHDPHSFPTRRSSDLLTEAQVKEELERSEAASGGSVTHDFDSWDLGFLADYIYNVHHKYIRESGPVIEQLVEKVDRKSTRLNSSDVKISYAVFCLTKK